jgi:putative inorganic carbon (hco3(-)) transporter
MKNSGLTIYLVFIVSWFLHFGARIPGLGTIRFDLLLVCILVFISFSARKKEHEPPATQTDKLLRALLILAVIAVPFSEWPGSVIKLGIPNLIKAVVFYYFTIAFVKTEADLKKFIFVFLACQLFRILEPLYLHFTEGYWGNSASMEGWDYLDRLSGAPSDVVNANGLAFIVCTVLPFLYFLSGLSWKLRLASLLASFAAILTLSLTGSRSGMVGLAVVLIGISVKSKKRVAVGAMITITAAAGFSFLSPDMQDRYLSLVGKGEKNAATASERTEGMEEQIRVAKLRPLLGHGLGTSAEANFHYATQGPYAGMAMPAHNLYVEIAQELGLAGVVVFVWFIYSIFSGFITSQRMIRLHDVGPFLPRLIDAMQVWFAMNIVFSFASYGLSSYEWYLFGGLSVALQRLVPRDLASEAVNGHGVARTMKVNH